MHGWPNTTLDNGSPELYDGQPPSDCSSRRMRKDELMGRTFSDNLPTYLRVRANRAWDKNDALSTRVFEEAADEIERLRAKENDMNKPPHRFGDPDHNPICEGSGHIWGSGTIETAKTGVNITIRCLRCPATKTRFFDCSHARARKAMLKFLTGKD